MKVKDVNNQSFQAIRGLMYKGKWDPQNPQSQLAEKAFKESKILQDYCKTNDVYVSFATDKIPMCEKGRSYAMLYIEKVFEPPKTFFGKVKNAIKRPFEAVCITSYGDDAKEATKFLRWEVAAKQEESLQKVIVKNSREINPHNVCKECSSLN